MRALLTIILFSLMSLMLVGQVPQKMSYQAVVRNNAGELIRNQPVGVRVTILQGTNEGPEVFKEIYNPNPETNSNGLVTFEIGAGIAVVGSFQVIDWANGPYFIKTEVDPTGGTNYSIVGVHQFLSVPFAFHAKTAESISQPMEETDPIFNQSPSANIEADDIGNWDEANTWGNHADEGYLTEETQTLEHVLIRGNDGGEIQIKNIADPTDPQDAVTKKYSDAMDKENKDYADRLWKEYEGSYSGEMKYWDGDKWAAVEQGQQGQALSLCDGTPTWGPCIPIVSTSEITDITDKSSTGGGEVINDRGFHVTSRGVVWSKSTNPTTGSNQGITTSGTGTGSFISNLTGLDPSTVYYVRAYATNSSGTGYGEQLVFETLPRYYSLSLLSDPEDGGILEGAGEYIAVTQVTISASSNDDFEFIEWKDGLGNTVSTQASFTYTMPSQNVTLTAKFRSLLYPPKSGLVAWYPFNGNANDESGNGNHGTVMGSVSLTTDRSNNPNSAYFFPGATNSYINISSNSSLDGFSEGISVSAWYFIQSTNYGDRLLQIGTVDGSKRGLMVAGGLKWALVVYDGKGAGLGRWPTFVVPNLGVWQHLVFVADFPNMKYYVYINGELREEAGSYYAGIFTGEINLSDLPFAIGRKAGSASDPWHGKIDEVGIWKRPLSANEVQILYEGK